MMAGLRFHSQRGFFSNVQYRTLNIQHRSWECPLRSTLDVECSMFDVHLQVSPLNDPSVLGGWASLKRERSPNGCVLHALIYSMCNFLRCTSRKARPGQRAGGYTSKMCAYFSGILFPSCMVRRRNAAGGVACQKQKIRLSRIVATLVFLLSLVPCGVHAATNDLDSAILQTRQEIKTALVELNTLRASIEKDREPLSKTHDDRSAAVREKRQVLERLQESKRYGEEQCRLLNANVLHLTEECRFVLTAISEYRRGLETRVLPTALQSYRPILKFCDELLVQEGNFSQLSLIASTLLPHAIAWNKERIGVHRMDGSALNHSGIEERGTFILMGPICYFVNVAGGGGLVLTRFGSLLPTYFNEHAPVEQRAIASLLTAPSACVPLDISNGDALKIAAAGDSFAEQIGKGGFVMVPLIIIGILSMALMLWKFLELRGMRLATTDSLADVIQHLNDAEPDQAIQAARALHKPLSAVIQDALAYRHAPREHLEEILHERILALVPGLERHLGTLAVFGGVAPLLGLLGTVTGMIHTFDLVTLFGTGEARLLSGGISEALITTKFGLAIAIPVLLVHAFLARRVRAIVGALENSAVHFVNSLKIEGPTP